jgi:nijmegen breakage syndrome protein 1
MGFCLCRIHYTPLVVSPSTIKDVAKLKKTVMTLGGHMVNEWSPNCDYVVMESLTLTVKAVCALLSAKSIVTSAFFDDLYECIITKKKRPHPNNFLPPLGEKRLQTDGLSFKPNPLRSQLFEGKTFLFSNQKQIKMIGVVVKCGGEKDQYYSIMVFCALK